MSKAWKEDFPIPADEDSYVTRRELTKFLGLTSLGFFFGTLAAATRKIWKSYTLHHPPATVLAAVDEVPVGGYKLFRYPTEGDPCILLRLTAQTFVAFNQNCTHLQCPVHFEAATKQLVCPCHKGFFSAEDGRPIAGPPKTPLAAIPVVVRDNRVWTEFSGEEYRGS